MIDRLLQKFLPAAKYNALRRYRTVSTWIWKDGVWRYKNATLLTIFLGLLGLGGEIATYSIIYKYAHFLESGRVLRIYDYEIYSRSSILLLVSAASLMFICAVLSAYSFYLSHKKSMDIWKSYEIFCVRRLMLLSSYLPHPASPMASRMLDKTTLKTMTKKEARYSGRMLFHILGLFLPLGRLLVSLVILFATNWFFSLIVFALLLTAQWFMHRLNVSASRHSRLFEASNLASRQERNMLMNHIWANPAPIDQNHPLLTINDADSMVRKSLSSFLNRLLIKEKTSLVVNLLTAVSLLLILVIAGAGIISGQWRWSVFLIFVVALRYFLNSLMHVSTSVTVISRYYPYIKNYFRFVNDAKAAQSGENADIRQTPVRLKVPAISPDRSELPLAAGRTVYAIHPGRVDRHLLKLFQEKTEANTSAGIYGFAGGRLLVQNSLRKSLGFPASVSSRQVNELLEEMLDIDSFVETVHVGGAAPYRLPDTSIKTAGIDLDTVVRNIEIPEMPQEVKGGLNMLAGVYSGRPVILLPNNGAGDWQGHFIRFLRRRFSERLIIEVHKQIPEYIPGDAIVLLSNGESLTGWATGDFMLENPDLVKQYIGSGREPKDSHVEVDDDDDH